MLLYVYKKTKSKGGNTMTDKEKEIMEVFKKVLPNLTREEKDRLLFFGKGMAFKAEENEKKELKEVV